MTNTLKERDAFVYFCKGVFEATLERINELVKNDGGHYTNEFIICETREAVNSCERIINEECDLRKLDACNKLHL